MKKSTMTILEKEEGFRGDMYFDTEGFPTIGFGTKLPISEEEGRLLVEYRIEKLEKELHKELQYLNIDERAWEILYLMSYQLGVAGVLKFKKMLAALEDEDYEEAAKEMLQSKWSKQTPARAKRMSDMMKGICNG